MASTNRGMAVNYVTFNQDNSLIGTATSKGFRLHYTDDCGLHYKNEEGDVSLLELLFSTQLVALTLSPRLVRILNTKRESTLCELTFPMKVLAVRMNRKRLVIVLEDSIYLYDISNMKLLNTVQTAANHNGLCALSPHSDRNIMACPQPSKQPVQPLNQPAHSPPSNGQQILASGEVMIYDADKCTAVNVIEAHVSSLGCLAMNSQGTMLATASAKGTIIRIFSIPSGDRLFQFRRGSLPAQIYCMSFNTTSSLLAVSSATETVHIFKTVAQQQQPSSRQQTSSQAAESALTGSPSPARETPTKHRGNSFSSQRSRSGSPSSEEYETTTKEPSPPSRRTSQTLASMIRRTSQNVGLSLAGRVGGYLPSSVTEMWEPARDFAWAKIPRSRSSMGVTGGAPVRSVVALSANRPQLLVVTSEGQYSIFNVDLEKGGEGVLEQQYSLSGSFDDD